MLAIGRALQNDRQRAFGMGGQIDIGGQMHAIAHGNRDIA